MSNNKQSSVEYLMDKLFDPSSMVKEQLEWFEQVKAIHKKQTIDFAEKAVSMVLNEDIQNPVSINQLYNETFNK